MLLDPSDHKHCTMSRQLPYVGTVPSYGYRTFLRRLAGSFTLCHTYEDNLCRGELHTARFIGSWTDADKKQENKGGVAIVNPPGIAQNHTRAIATPRSLHCEEFLKGCRPSRYLCWTMEPEMFDRSEMPSLPAVMRSKTSPNPLRLLLPRPSSFLELGRMVRP